VKRVVVAIVACLVPGLAMALACGRDAVVVATIEASDAAIVCNTPDASAGCPDGSFCEQSSCDDASPGVCQPVESASCVEQYGPQCGCDGLSYYNACRRRAAQENAKDDAGPCGPGLGQTCSLIFGPSCGPNAVCEPTFFALPPSVPVAELTFLSSLLAPTQICQQATASPVGMLGGTCWVHPKNGDTEGQVYSLCGGRCSSALAAIQEGGVYGFCPPDASTN
jgi:hypothetical protein